jgi:hypothetical protein
MRVHSSLLALAVFLFAAIAVHAQDTSVADCNKVKELPTYKTCFAAKEKAGAPSGVSITCAGARAQFECIGAEGQSAVDKCCKAGTAMLNSYTTTWTTNNCTGTIGTYCKAAAAAAATDPLASSSTGCFKGFIGAWKAESGCTCHSTCRTCSKGEGAAAPTEKDCLACKGTAKLTVVQQADKSGTCTSAASMLQAGAVVSALLAFVVALASA